MYDQAGLLRKRRPTRFAGASARVTAAPTPPPSPPEHPSGSMDAHASSSTAVMEAARSDAHAVTHLPSPSRLPPPATAAAPGALRSMHDRDESKPSLYGRQPTDLFEFIFDAHGDMNRDVSSCLGESSISCLTACSVRPCLMTPRGTLAYAHPVSCSSLFLSSHCLAPSCMRA